MVTLLELGKKIGRHLQLARDDPRRFAANRLQRLDPGRREKKQIDIQDFEKTLIDIQTASPAHIILNESLSSRPTLTMVQQLRSGTRDL